MSFSGVQRVSDLLKKVSGSIPSVDRVTPGNPRCEAVTAGAAPGGGACGLCEDPRSLRAGSTGAWAVPWEAQATRWAEACVSPRSRLCGRLAGCGPLRCRASGAKGWGAQPSGPACPLGRTTRTVMCLLQGFTVGHGRTRPRGASCPTPHLGQLGQYPRQGGRPRP